MMQISFRILIACIFLLTMQSFAYADTAAQTSFRIGGGGEDYPTSTPLVLPDGNLVIAIFTQGGLGGEPLDVKGARKTYVACLDSEQNPVWQTVLEGTVTLYGLDAQGDVQAFWRHSETGDTYAQFITLRAQTGEQISNHPAVKLTISQVGDNPQVGTMLSPDYVLIKEIHDPDATTRPRYFRLFNQAGDELWKKEQQEISIQNVDTFEQLRDGVLLIGGSGKQSQDGRGLPIVVKISFAGEVLWKYIPQNMQQGLLLHALHAGDGQLILFGFGRTEVSADSPVTWQIITAVDEKSGEVLWEKEYRGTEIHIGLRCDATPVPNGYVETIFDNSTHAFVSAQFDLAGEYQKSWLVSAPGFSLYRSVSPFYWQGQLWVQATVDNDYRWDAHYQRIDDTMGNGL